jgi:glyoxylate/hydroxypyruvate reductase
MLRPATGDDVKEGGMIAFVTRLEAHIEADWLERLRARLPEETIVSFRSMSRADRTEADIAIVANPDPIDLHELVGLQWVHSVWAGVENLVADMGPAAVPIVRLVDPELARVMGEAVLAWTYFIHRGMPEYRRQQEERLWQQLSYRHPSQVNVGVLGLGELGLAAAERLRGAGFTVIGWSRSPKMLFDFECLHGAGGLRVVLGRADILVCLLPLTAETRGLLSGEQFGSMPKGASVINFARGPIIDAADLLRSLNSGHVAHAVLDVFDLEPLPTDSELWSHPRVTVLPHISAPTNRDSAAAIVAANIRSYRRTGQLPRAVDQQQGY